MSTQDRYVRRICGWRSALMGYLLAALLLLSSSAMAAQQMPELAGPATPARKVYVGLFKDDAVAVVDTGTNRVLSTIAVPPGPHGLVITPDGRKVYVSSDGASTVSVIDTTLDQVVGSIEVGPNPHGLAMSSDGQKLLVSAFGANQAIIIDTSGDRIIGQMPVPLAHNGAISADGKTAYVGSQQKGATALVVLDLSAMREVTRIGLDSTPRGLDLSPDGKWLYFTVAGMDAVLVLDTTTHRIAGQIATGASPHIAVFAPNGQTAMAVSQGPGELEILEPTHHTVSTTVKIGKAPHWLAVSTDGRTTYVTNEGSDDVSIVDVMNRRVLATIPVGRAPRKIAVHPGATAPAPAPAKRSSRPAAPTFADHGSRDVRGQAALTLEADDYYFAPTFLRGEPGQTLRLQVENESRTLHNISFPALHIDQDIPPKGSVDVQVTFPPSGTVRFLCKLHAALGMNGKILAGENTLE
jgi:YVTN family beta-propeller protein